jgi:hypothetical protein
MSMSSHTVKKTKWVRAEVWQHGLMVACVEGPTRKSIERDVCHYAVQYAQDGPVSVLYSDDFGSTES